VVSIRMHMLAHEAGDCEGIQKSPLVGETDGHFSATRYYILTRRIHIHTRTGRNAGGERF
jgi:hypothetical protein